MNVALLKKVRAAILDRPDQFEMDWFFQDSLNLGGKELPAGGCGTAACIAGWAIHVSGKEKKLAVTQRLNHGIDEWEKGRKLCRLDTDEASRLFERWRWPKPFDRNYLISKTPADRAKVAAARIDHFIKTQGAE